MLPDISAIIQSGTINPWFYLPVAVLLGALHALEPGHSKSVMAAFIVAIRGTSGQAVLLGVSAAFGHSVTVWGLAAVGLWLGDALIVERAEPWLILISGLMIVFLALRLLWVVTGSSSRHHGHHGHHDDHADAHGHSHMSEEDIRDKYKGRQVSSGEIVWFGFTGGLLPCPAAIAVLLVSLHLKQFVLGAAMVMAFSLGLAITLVSIGVAAAWGTRRAAQSWPGFERFAGRAPFMSGMIVLAVGAALTFQGIRALGVV
jgi:nickel/cobalt transporter (NicO) family protein